MNDQERDFYAEIGIEFPSDAPTTAESTEQFEYYKHPAGLYKGFVGLLKPSYKDANGKRVDMGTPGALFSHYNLPFWITEFMGTTSVPMMEKLLVVAKDKILIPTRPIAELHYNNFISADPTKQWTLKSAYGGWQIEGRPEYKLIMPSPTNPAKTITNFKGFLAYYGMYISFALTYKAASEKQSRYVDGKVELLSANRIPLNVLKTFEAEIDSAVEKERESRRNSDSNTPPPPSTNFDSLLNDDEDSIGDFTGA